MLSDGLTSSRQGNAWNELRGHKHISRDGLVPKAHPSRSASENQSVVIQHQSLSLAHGRNQTRQSVQGAIAMDTNPAQQALKYAEAGASVISVLTEPTWFKGSLLDMHLVRAVDKTPNRPAILRKEFIFEEYQIAEARLHGADTVLLIVAMLTHEQLTALYKYSCSWEFAFLRGRSGDNNQTSRSGEGEGCHLCALSGISGPTQDVRVYKEQSVHAVLVGEALMRAQDTTTFIRELLEWPA
ncbi:indole-3-glycerol phosphate synthase [Mycena olivaceomarginata]|nr:indole-3-glycerol phosphate synthase [Mycena olivaceomarginata]